YAIEGVTDALQFELVPLGINVKLVEPGAIKTEFGKSLSLSNDPAIPDYQPLLDSAMSTYGGLMGAASEPELIAEQILAAATDEGRKLRFPAGDDAVRYFAEREAVTDEQYFATVAKQFGLQA
ncbi:MAG: short-chain dehydrogenase/reductase, partial [Pseudomonadota bacterium]|nr:short-chain dehydrogenase/reductase [Pseudomonadota bacterium]